MNLPLRYKKLLWLLALLTASCGTSIHKHDVYIPKNYEKKAVNNNIDYGMHQAWLDIPNIVSCNKVFINIFINPIQEHVNSWDSFNVRNLVSTKKDDSLYIARYARRSFIEAFKNSTQFKLADTIDPDTIKLNFAIVQIVPNKPILGGITNILGITPIGLLLDPLKAGIKGASASNGGAIAMETILTKPAGNKIVAIFADREKGENVLIFNAEEFVAYGNIREIIDHWTKQIVNILDSVKQGKTVNPNWQQEFSFIKF